jgi:hypothetical protein
MLHVPVKDFDSLLKTQKKRLEETKTAKVTNKEGEQTQGNEYFPLGESDWKLRPLNLHNLQRKKGLKKKKIKKKKKKKEKSLEGKKKKKKKKREEKAGKRWVTNVYVKV